MRNTKNAQLCSHNGTSNNVIQTIVQLTLKAWVAPPFIFSKICSQSHDSSWDFGENYHKLPLQI